MIAKISLLLLFATVLSNGASLNLKAGRYYGEVVFIGDSITQFWGNDGKVVWDQYYAPLGAVNVGVSGDATQQTIDRILGGSIDNLNSRLAVLKIGTNDLSYNSPEPTVADQIGKILSLIKERVPGIKILLLGILPRGDGLDGIMHQRVRNVNEIIKNYDDGQTVFSIWKTNFRHPWATSFQNCIGKTGSTWPHRGISGGLKRWVLSLMKCFVQINFRVRMYSLIWW